MDSRRPIGRLDVRRQSGSVGPHLAAGLVDEIQLHVVPILLGDGARLFGGVGPGLRLEQVRAVEAPGVAHVKYRVMT